LDDFDIWIRSSSLVALLLPAIEEALGDAWSSADRKVARSRIRTMGL